MGNFIFYKRDFAEYEIARSEDFIIEPYKNHSLTSDSKASMITMCIDKNLLYSFDEAILGKWVAHDFIERKSDFKENPNHTVFEPYFKAVEFLHDGECISIYGNEIIGGEIQCWTKGYILRKFNHNACAYEVRRVNGRDYLIIEWKSGDYRRGGFDTDYYVFVRG